MSNSLRKKIIKVSKLTFYILVIHSVFASLLMAAEPANSQMLSSVSLEWKPQDLTLEETLQLIAEKTGFEFFYNPKKLPLHKTTRVTKTGNLKEMLQEIANLYYLEFRRVEKVISVKPGEKRVVEVQEETGQEIQVSGKVSDGETGEPIIGATVLVFGSTIGTVSDMAGNYKLTLPNEAEKLVFSFVGFQSQVVVIGNQSTINVQLLPDVQTLEDVVVVGYGTQERANVTGAVGKLKAENYKDYPISSFDQGLAGRLPGVDISQANGAPGAGIGINIRGVSSITGGTSPLIVVDGVPLNSSSSEQFSQGQSTDNNFSVGYFINPLSSINPNDIESIEVLKDAAAAAIYGSRGSNGVILITTKSGKKDQPAQISLNIYGGIQEVTKKIDVMDAYEFASYSKLSRDLAWISKDPVNNSADDPLDERATSGDKYASYLLPYINGETGLPNTDWQDEIFRNAPVQNYELSTSGGTKKLSYYVSGNYFDQEGVVINSGLKRYGARFNLNAELTDFLSVGVNFNPSFSNYNIVQTEQNWWREGVIITALMYHPNLPVKNEDGTYALGNMIRTNQSGESSVATIENPVALAEMIDNQLEHTRLLGNTFLKFNLLPGLDFKTSLGVDINYMNRFFYRPKQLNWRNEYAPTTTNNYAWSNNSNVINWLSENTFNYAKSVDGHNFEALLGYSVQKETNKRQYLEGRNFPNDNVNSLNAAQSTTGYTEDREWSLLSYIGRIQYDYNGKYLLTASLRRDGSSRFGKNSKWGWFPSFSAGWRISDEGFFPQNDMITDLKIRASYGMTGNTNIPYYGGTALLGIEGYVLGDNVVTGLAPETSPNPNLSWETTKTFDVGVDMGLIRNKLSLSIDYYKSETEDLLLDVTVPGTSGFESSLQNIGSLSNTGVEFLLSTNIDAGDFSWRGSVNASVNKNEIKSLAPGQDQFLVNGGLNDPSFIVKVGESIGSYYGYKVNGVFESEEQFENTPHLEGQNQGVGDFIYADTDNDGDVDADDRTILGDNNPDFTWGFQSEFNYKGFDLGFNIQGKHGFQLFNAMHRYLAETWGNNLAVYLNEDAPRPVWGVGTSSHTRPSSWHVENGSFVRVRNITLGYTLPKKLVGDKFGKSLRIYCSTLNPFTFTDYSGYNPEVSNNFGDAVRAGEEFGNYPVYKSYILGINFTF